MQWRDHQAPKNIETLQATLQTLTPNEAQKHFLDTLRGTAYTYKNITVVITSTRPRNTAVRLRAYKDTRETPGENYFLINIYHLPWAISMEATKLIEEERATTTPHHHRTRDTP